MTTRLLDGCICLLHYQHETEGRIRIGASVVRLAGDRNLVRGMLSRGHTVHSGIAHEEAVDGPSAALRWMAALDTVGIHKLWIISFRAGWTHDL